MTSEVMHVLIVEDHFLIAKQLELLVVEAGHVHVGTAMNRPKAMTLAQETQPDLALVDVNLADGPSGIEAATDIAAVSGAEILFVTANRRRLPEGCGDAIGVVEKPFTGSTILATLRYIAQRIGARLAQGAQAAKPPELDLSPRYAARWR